MTAPIPTPMLDKAVSSELTSSEIIAALKELTALDPDKRCFSFEVTPSHLVVMVVSIHRSFERHLTIEAALIAQHKDLLEIVAEIEAGA